MEDRALKVHVAVTALSVYIALPQGTEAVGSQEKGPGMISKPPVGSVMSCYGGLDLLLQAGGCWVTVP